MELGNECKLDRNIIIQKTHYTRDLLCVILATFGASKYPFEVQTKGIVPLLHQVN